MPRENSSNRRARPAGGSSRSAGPRSGGDRPYRASGGPRRDDDRRPRRDFDPDRPRPPRDDDDRRPRRSFGDSPSAGARRPYESRDSRPARDSYRDNDRPRRSFSDGDRRPARDDDRRSPRPYGGDDRRPPRDGGARPARPFAGGDRRGPRDGGSRPPRREFDDRRGAPRRDDDRRSPRPYGSDDRRPPRDGGARPPRREFDDRRGGPRRSGPPGARPPRRDYDSAPRDRWSEDRPTPSRPPRDESRPRIQRDDARPRFDRDDSRPRFDRDDRSRGGRPSYGDRRERPLTPEEQERIDAERIAKSRGWGGVARKGAVHIKSTGGDFQSPREMTPDNRRPDEWIMDDRPSAPAKPKMTSARKPYQLPQDIVTEIRRVFQGSAFQREKMVTFMSNAAEAYDRHRYEEALRLAKTVAEAVPTVAPVLELAGLAAYRAERFPMARKHLRMAFEITGDAQHLPLVMDCERAARRYTLVEGTFSQLVESEPTVEVLAEGRIVMASSLADQKRFQEAIDLLIKSGGSKILRNPSGRHVRMWYALADVYDRAGDVASARELFARVVAVDPEAYDAIARLGDLGGTGTVRKNRKKRTTPVSKKKNID